MGERLLDVVRRLRDIPPGDRYEPGPTLFAVPPWDESSNTLVLSEEVLGGVASTARDHAYLLDVSIAREVLEVWSLWRDGRRPRPSEAVEAIIHYATHDAYLPVS